MTYKLTRHFWLPNALLPSSDQRSSALINKCLCVSMCVQVSRPPYPHLCIYIYITRYKLIKHFWFLSIRPIIDCWRSIAAYNAVQYLVGFGWLPAMLSAPCGLCFRLHINMIVQIMCCFFLTTGNVNCCPLSIYFRLLSGLELRLES